MKKVFFLFNLFLLCNCNPFYKEYKTLNASTHKNNLYVKQLHLIKPLISKEKSPFVLVISWNKNILVKNGNLHYSALIYNPQNGEKKMFVASEENPKMVMQSNIFSDKKINKKQKYAKRLKPLLYNAL